MQGSYCSVEFIVCENGFLKNRNYLELGCGVEMNTPDLCQTEIKGRPYVLFTFRPDCPVVFLNDSFCNRKADSGSLEVLGGMQADIRDEHPGGFFPVISRTVIAEKITALPVLVDCTEFDAGHLSFGGEFPCVADKIIHHNPEKPGIRVHRQTGLNMDLRFAARVRGLQF